MAVIKVADIVAGVPYGNEGRKRWRTVGALLKHTDNDPAKGPGFTIALDRLFNPAGLPDRDGDAMLSCFHPKDPAQARGAAAADTYRAPKPPPQPDFPDDDIPF